MNSLIDLLGLLIEIFDRRNKSKKEIMKDVPNFLYARIDNKRQLDDFISNRELKLLGEICLEYGPEDFEGNIQPTILLKGELKEGFEYSEDKRYYLIAILNKGISLDVRNVVGLENRVVQFRYGRNAIPIKKFENVCFIADVNHQLKEVTLVASKFIATIRLERLDEFPQQISEKDIEFE